MASERERRVPLETGQPEQSMDEILASIRQIIADDGAEKPTHGERRGLTPPSDISNSNTVRAGRPIPSTPPGLPSAPVPEPASIPRQSGQSFDDELAAGMAQALAIEPEPAHIPAPPPTSRSATELALQRLNTEDVARSVVERWIGTNNDEITRQVEGVVEPVVRAWLAENLPALVERLIREEIEAVSRGTRR